MWIHNCPGLMMALGGDSAPGAVLFFCACAALQLYRDGRGRGLACSGSRPPPPAADPPSPADFAGSPPVRMWSTCGHARDSDSHHRVFLQPKFAIGIGIIGLQVMPVRPRPMGHAHAALFPIDSSAA